MRGLFRSLRFRFLVSYLLVVGVGAATLVLTIRLLAPSYFDAHLAEMTRTIGMMSVPMVDELEQGFNSSITRALVVSMVASAGAAVLVTAFAVERVLRPLDVVRKAARRLASGSYGERVPEPQESELAALAADVNALAEALDTVEQRRVQLISEVAHELRTPLSTIEGYMEGLLDGVFPPSEEIFAATAREAARLKRLAEDLSSLSKAEEGSVTLRVAQADLRSIAADVAGRLRPQFSDQDVGLEVVGGEPLPVLVDRDRMAQVFTNLIGNALTHTPAGGRVRVEGRADHGDAIVSIIDTGRGIDPAEIDRIFERFYRVDPTGPGGTGIGLTIARSLARLHGGDVTASSLGPGTGSTFTVRVPLDRD